MTEDQPELPSAIEEPGGPAPPPRFEVMDRPRLRTWFQSSDGTQLLQIQRNRIAYNWKRGPASEPYPSYDEVERRFRKLLPLWIDFIESEVFTSNRAEILNLNMVARGTPTPSDIDGAIAFLRLGHEWIVRAFAEITTPEMHAKWKRTQ